MKKLIAARALLFCAILFFAAAAFGQAKSSAGKKSPRVYGEWKTSDVDCLLLDTDNYAWFFLDDGKDTVVAYGMYSYNLDFIKIKAANVWRVSEDSRTCDVDFVFPYYFDAENNLQIEAFGKKYHFTKYALKNGLYPPKDGSLDGTWTCKFYGTENGQKFCLDTNLHLWRSDDYAVLSRRRFLPNVGQPYFLQQQYSLSKQRGGRLYTAQPKGK